jgi:methionyl-tRNA formyltransferase
MNRPLKVLFFGNHTLGVRTLKSIATRARIVGVVAHPDDPEDGVRYESVFTSAGALGVPVLRLAGKRPELADFVRRCAPDLIWITDYRYLLPEAILALAPLGAVNLHPSLLPKYRGRAPVNWGILHGETRFGLTAHFVDAGMDTGDIIAQREYTLAQAEDIADALEKLYPLYEELAGEVLGYFLAGSVPRRAQAHADASAFPRRTPADGQIEWARPAREVWNLVRAVAAPYPGAFAAWGLGRVMIWKVAGVIPLEPRSNHLPGEVISVGPGHRLTVACGDAALEVEEFSVEMADERMLTRGALLGDPALLEVAS